MNKIDEPTMEMHIMQLAAISTASIQNTESTIKDRIDRSNPYWTVAYDDVCHAVDREMQLRARVRELEEALQDYVSKIQVCCHCGEPAPCGCEPATQGKVW